MAYGLCFMSSKRQLILPSLMAALMAGLIVFVVMALTGPGSSAAEAAPVKTRFVAGPTETMPVPGPVVTKIRVQTKIKRIVRTIHVTEAPQAASRSQHREAPQNVSTGRTEALTGIWRSLAMCESGLNPRAYNPVGPFYGLYQFTLPTWQSVGGSGDPRDASASEQLHRAQILQARSGFGQWPACSAKLGL